MPEQYTTEILTLMQEFISCNLVMKSQDSTYHDDNNENSS